MWNKKERQEASLWKHFSSQWASDKMFLIDECAKGRNGFLTAVGELFGFMVLFLCFPYSKTLPENAACLGWNIPVYGRPRSHCWSILRDLLNEGNGSGQWSLPEQDLLCFSPLPRGSWTIVLVARCISRWSVTVVPLQFCSLGICLLGDLPLLIPYPFSSLKLTLLWIYSVFVMKLPPVPPIFLLFLVSLQ